MLYTQLHSWTAMPGLLSRAALAARLRARGPARRLGRLRPELAVLALRKKMGSLYQQRMRLVSKRMENLRLVSKNEVSV